MAIPENLRNEKKQGESIGFKVGVLAAFIAAALTAMTFATQYFAYSVHYWDGLSGRQIFVWRGEHQDQIALFEKPVKLAFSIWLLLTVMVFGIVMMVKNKLHGLKTLHGSARWADIEDIKRAGLIQNSDPKTDKEPYVYVGAYKGKDGKTVYLRHSGPEHILT